MHIYCDFDGTISTVDTTDAILTQLADPAWEIIEAEWKAGEMGSAECMQRQIALIHADKDTLDASLDALTLDTTFKPFLNFCRQNDFPISVLSDGVDYFINRILARHGVSDIEVRANHLTITEKGGYALTSPYRNSGCYANSGVCKCKAMTNHRELSIFIGDGRSDFCASGSADIVFAKGTLATFCAQQGIPYYAFNSFSDIQMMLPSLLHSVRHEQHQFLAPAASL